MKKRLLYLFFAATLTFGAAYGWEENVSKNTQVTPTGLDYLETDIRTNAKGETFVFILGAGSPTSMRLQIIDAEGNKVLTRGGQLISNEPNNSWFGYNQYLELDKAGNAFVGVQDYRAHPQEQLFTYSIYKYSDLGEQLIGGSLLNDGEGGKLLSGLSMCATDDGGVVCAYNRTSEVDNKDYLQAEKLDSTGKSMWRKTLLSTHAVSGALPFLAEASDGNIKVFIATGGKIKENLINAEGSLLWNDFKTIYTSGMASPRLWEIMDVHRIKGEKTVFSIVDGEKQGRILVINGDGSIGLDGSDKGITLNDNTYYVSDMPAVAYNEGNNTYTCVYKIMDRKNIAYSSLLAQRINADGTPAWSEPKEVMPFDENAWYGKCILQDGEKGRNALFYLQMNTQNYNDVKAYMIILDNQGTLEKEPQAFATSETSKLNLRVSELTGKHFIAAWDEESNGQTSLFMRSIQLPANSDINNVEIDREEYPVNTEYYSLDGKRLSGPQKGLNIVKNGHQVKKIILK